MSKEKASLYEMPPTAVCDSHEFWRRLCGLQNDVPSTQMEMWQRFCCRKVQLFNARHFKLPLKRVSILTITFRLPTNRRNCPRVTTPSMGPRHGGRKALLIPTVMCQVNLSILRFYSPTKPRVARWIVFKPKIPILLKFGGPWNRKCYILWPFRIFYGRWYNLQPFGIVYIWSFGIFFPFWYAWI
jgi:hypothetical protein